MKQFQKRLLVSAIIIVQPGLSVWMVLLLNFLGLAVELSGFIVLAASLFALDIGAVYLHIAAVDCLPSVSSDRDIPRTRLGNSFIWYGGLCYLIASIAYSSNLSLVRMNHFSLLSILLRRRNNLHMVSLCVQ